MVPLPQVSDIAALALCDAAYQGSVSRVESLLASGVDPNARFDNLSVSSGVAEDWASADKAAHPPISFYDRNEAPALRRAAQDGNIRDAADKPRLTRIMTALLERGADPYALFRQPIHTHHGRPLFPDENTDEEYEAEETDLMAMTQSDSEVLRKELEFEEFRQQGRPIPGIDDSDYESDNAYDMACEYQPQYPRQYGMYCVAHSLLEQGMFVRPVLDHLGDRDIDHRDPQGRTLFLAACRSALGLEASIDGNFNALSWDYDFRGIRENPYIIPGNPWRQLEREGQTQTCQGPTLLEFFMTRGADVLAVDNYGRNALHQLFTCFHLDAQNQPPMIHTALAFLVSKFPSLVNQPDHAGFYPLHLAIRRMGNYTLAESGHIPAEIYHLETAVDELLAGGADPLVRDAHGNTAVHYLAASRLGKDNRIGKEQRRLLRVFLDRDVNPGAHNAAGVSALEMFLQKGVDSEARDRGRHHVIRQEVIGIFEEYQYQ